MKGLKLIAELKGEFSRDRGAPTQARIESVYTNIRQVAGTPLRDSYHFGQTLVNDYGRPLEKGTNTDDGFSAYATAGRFSAYFSGEYQEAAGRAAPDQNIRNLLGFLDGVPPQPALATPPTSKFEPLEMYLGVKLGLFDVTFGKQSFWWGPDENSAFSFSNNAPPIYGLQIAQSAPIILPGPFRFLGRIRTQLLIGKLSGHLYPPRPLINAEKITLQVTQNLEFGFTRSSIFGGVGHPLTLKSFYEGFFSVSSTGSTVYGSANDPGDRRSGFDFRWYLPGSGACPVLARWPGDEVIPSVTAASSPAWCPALFPQCAPDSGARFASGWLLVVALHGDQGGLFFYWNNQYRDAYTNGQFLLGSWVGRDARAYVGSSTYWWSAKNKVTASFRQVKTGSNFLPGGGTQTDVSVNCQWSLTPQLLASGFVQFERYLIPALGGPQRDVVAGVSLVFYPDKWAVHGKDR